jgi:hypothetical protein
VKAYERTRTREAAEHSSALARLVLLEYPIVGQLEIARDVLASMSRAGSQHLGYLS